MPLSSDDLIQIEKIVQTTTQNGCRCGLSDSSQAEMGHLIGRFKDIGDGNLNKGIEEGQARPSRHGSKSGGGGEKVGGAVACFIAVSVFGASARCSGSASSSL